MGTSTVSLSAISEAQKLPSHVHVHTLVGGVK